MLRQASVGFCLRRSLFAFTSGVGLIGLGASHPRTGVCELSVAASIRKMCTLPVSTRRCSGRLGGRPDGSWLLALGYCCTISIVGLSSGLADLLAWTLSEPGWAGLEDGLGWVVVVWGCCGDGGGLVWMVGAPLGRHVALTLALSRRAGEGTCCCLRGYCCEDRGWWFGGGGCCGEFRASPCSLRSRPPSLCEGGGGRGLVCIFGVNCWRILQ